MREFINIVESQLNGREDIPKDASALVSWAQTKLTVLRSLLQHIPFHDGPARGTELATANPDGSVTFTPKFWDMVQHYGPNLALHIIAHEVGHVVSGMVGHSTWIKMADDLGLDIWDVATLPFGEPNMEEAFAEVFSVLTTEDPEDLHKLGRFPLWAKLVRQVAALVGLRLYRVGITEAADIDIERGGEEQTTVLYHGTLRKHVPSILKSGLRPGLGFHALQAYTVYVENGTHVPELVFAADIAHLGGCVSAMGSLIKKEYGLRHDDAYGPVGIGQYGALCVIETAAYKFAHRHEDEEDWADHFPHVEPGDYYYDFPVKIDRVIEGDELVAFLERNGGFRNRRT